MEIVTGRNIALLSTPLIYASAGTGNSSRVTILLTCFCHYSFLVGKFFTFHQTVTFHVAYNYEALKMGDLNSLV